MNSIYLSIVSPVYKAEEIIDELVKRTVEEVKKITPNFEFILVEDGGPDHSWQKIEESCVKDSRIKGIKLSRNFGQHYAITAGLEHAQGEWIVVMDCDLQDNPSEIHILHKKAMEGFDKVYASRKNRKDHFLKRFFSILFYNVLGYLTNTIQDPTIANFGIYHRKVIKAILSMGDSVRYLPTMSRWVGFKMATIEVKHDPRFNGKTTYSFSKLFQLGINNILSFSEKPLLLTVRLGLLISLLSFIIGLFFILEFFLGKIKVVGWTSLIISIWFLSGIIISVIGMVGLYVGKIFEKVKNRPSYIIEKVI